MAFYLLWKHISVAKEAKLDVVAFGTRDSLQF